MSDKVLGMMSTRPAVVTSAWHVGVVDAEVGLTPPRDLVGVPGGVHVAVGEPAKGKVRGTLLVKVKLPQGEGDALVKEF